MKTERESESGGGVGSSVGVGRVVVFAIYSLLYEAIVWGIFGYAVFVKDRSGWWVLSPLWISILGVVGIVALIAWLDSRK